jgi:hypothetical protein
MGSNAQYTPPEIDKDAFNCPYCEAYASQKWSNLKINKENSRVSTPAPSVQGAKRSRCRNCRRYHIWVNGEMVYPKRSPAPLPADEIPNDVEGDYREARQVVSDSPKAAAALLRRAIEELIEYLLDEPEGHLYSDIETLAEENIIDDRIRKGFDTIRVSGNDYTHAGRIYPDDNRQKAIKLFELTNIIVRTTIAEDKLINELYEDIPDTKKRENN